MRGCTKKRFKEYTKLNYQMAEDEKTRANQTQFYTEADYEDALQFDFTQAKHIVMGVVSVQQIHLEALKALRKSDKEITLVVKDEYFKKHEKLLVELKKLDIHIEFLQTHPFSFVVCDEQIVWYGNLKYFAKRNTNATTLRLSSKDIAEKILRQYLE